MSTIATSTLTLYKDCKITKEKNFVVSNVAFYLNDLTKTTIANFQYNKNIHDINIDVKIVLNQEDQAVDGKSEHYDYYNYASIKNSTEEKVYYYFIDKLEWLSQNTYRLKLSLDALNTFQPYDSFYFRDNCFIEREHKDRFDPVPSYTTTQMDPNDTIKYGHKYIMGFTGIDPDLGNFEMYTNSDINRMRISKINYQTEQVVQTWNFNRIAEEYDYGDLEHSWFNLFNVNGTLITSINKVDLNQSGYIYVFESFCQTPSDLIKSVGWQNYIYTERVPSYKRYIDHIPENINPVLYTNDDGVDIQDGTFMNWYLLYYSTTGRDDGVIHGAVIPEQAITIQTKTQYHLITPSMLSDDEDIAYGWNVSMLVRPGWGEHSDEAKIGGSYNLSNDPNADGVCLTSYSTTVGAGRGTRYFNSYVIFYKRNNTITVEVRDGENGSLKQKVEGLAAIKFVYNDETLASISPCVKDGVISHRWISWVDEDQQTITCTSGNASIPTCINGIEDLDNTNSKIISLIKLPYCPVPVTRRNGILVLNGTNLAITDSVLNITTLEFPTKFGNKLQKTFVDDNFNLFKDCYVQNVDIDLQDNRDDIYESKLYNSEFYQPSFYYDSYRMNFELENVEIPSPSAYNRVEFDTSTTTRSVFMFKFLAYNNQASTRPFANVLVVDRNNQMPVYTSAYLNYIRTGYNYDVKAKERSTRDSIVNSLAGAAKGAGAGLITGSVATAAVGAGIGLAKGIYNTISDANQAEENIQRKLDEYGNQAATVNTADDVDLLDNYTNNRAKYTIYTCSENVKKLTADLFYYCGYKCGYTGTPDINSRYWFNYFQGDIKMNFVCNMTQEMKDLLTLKYKEGITYLHNRIYNDTRVWDFDQEKENWEINLINN